MKKLMALICAVSMICALAIHGNACIIYTWTYRNIDEVIHGKGGFDTSGNELEISAMETIITGTAINHEMVRENEWGRFTKATVRITRVLSGDYQVGDTIEVWSSGLAEPEQGEYNWSTDGPWLTIGKDYVLFLRASEWNEAERYWLGTFSELRANGSIENAHRAAGHGGIWDGLTLDRIQDSINNGPVKAEIRDALDILLYLAGIGWWSDLTLLNLDFDGDGFVTINDALEVLMYLAGLPSVLSGEVKRGMPFIRSDCGCEGAHSEIITIAGRRLCSKTKHIPFNTDNFTNTDVAQLVNFTQLDSLWLAGSNRVTSISPLRSLTNLTSLGINTDNIRDLSPLRSLVNLEWLGLYGDIEKTSDINISPLTSLTSLRHINFAGVRFTDISPLSTMTHLRTLTLYNTQLTDISAVSTLVNLENLTMGFNQITDISPLVSLQKLNTLALYSNQITDISPLAELTNLRTVYLTDNPIESLAPLNSLPRLERVDFNDLTWYRRNGRPNFD